jgi:subtilisin family serine protease
VIPGLLNVISVAATDQDDNITDFSSYGTGSVHIAAPGNNIYSTIPKYDTVSGEISPLSVANGWSRQANAST